MTGSLLAGIAAICAVHGSMDLKKQCQQDIAKCTSNKIDAAVRIALALGSEYFEQWALECIKDGVGFGAPVPTVNEAMGIVTPKKKP